MREGKDNEGGEEQVDVVCGTEKGIKIRRKQKLLEEYELKKCIGETLER